jgi:hypothetical protein
MTLRRMLSFLLLAAAFFLATWLGWWMIPLVGLVWGWLRPAVPRPLLAALLAALLAWAGWLVVDLLSDSGAFARLGSRLGALFPLPFAALLGLTLLLAGLLAWTAAAVGRWLAGTRHAARASRE